jgi:hypothetical protein
LKIVLGNLNYLGCITARGEKMSRWIEDFENHAFQAAWQNVISSAEEISISAGASEPNLKECARLRKVVKYIDKLLECSDPELIPKGVWDKFTGESTNIKNQIEQFNQNENFGHLTNANASLDNLLAYICPFVRNGKVAAQTAGRAFKTYSNTITEQLEKFESTANKALEETVEASESADAILLQMKDQKDEFNKLKQELLVGNEEEPSLKKRMETLEEETKIRHRSVIDFFEKLTKGGEEESAITFQIDEAKTKALENAQKAEVALEDSQKVIEKLSDFHEKVFGKENEEGETVGGLKSELDARNRALTDFQKRQEIKYATLIGEIESLLPGATSAGLAAAYKDLKDSYNSPIEKSSLMFYGSLMGLLIVGLMLVADKIGWFYIDFVEIDEPLKLLNNFLFKLPLTIPLVWFAVFASKRRSQNMRLQQEYAHKEALAKSYHGYKKQIEGLGNDKDDILLKQLLQAAIESVSFNASVTLDGKHEDRIPLFDDSDSLIKLIKASSGN